MLTEGTIVKINKPKGNRYQAITTDDIDVTDQLNTHTMRNAFNAGRALKLTFTQKTDRERWIQVPIVEFDKIVRNVDSLIEPDIHFHNNKNDDTTGMDHEDFKLYIKNALNLKPKKLKIQSHWWRFAVRSVMRGKNLLVIGPSGCGKTLLANSLKIALNRQDKFFNINLGSTQDARSTLIGNTHFNPEKGTFVALSYFAQAIQIPNALILLDEVSRAHPDAINILMSVLDSTQKYMRIDEDPNTPTLKVAPGVSFILTANVGLEYTGTRTMDRAFLDRCAIVEMTPLQFVEGFLILHQMFPDVIEKHLFAIASIAQISRTEVSQNTGNVDTIVSTRACEEMAALIHDGFSLSEAAEIYIYPFHEDLGEGSGRMFMKQLVQKFIGDDESEDSIHTDSDTSPWRTNEESSSS